LAILAAGVASGVLVFVVLSRVGPLSPGPSPGPTAPAGAFDVTRFGAVGDGTTDSASAIQSAINAAGAAGGGDVYFPAGNYVAATSTLNISSANVTLDGAGRVSTRLTEGTPGRKLLTVTADHTTIENLTLDSFARGGGPAVGISSSYNAVRHCSILGATGGSWPLRFAGGQGSAKPQEPSYATGNVVDDLVLHDTAPGRNDGLDFSFQQNATLSNVQHTGSRLGLYVDRYVMVTDYTFAPDPTLTSGTYGYFITAPGDHITITNFTTSGQGGKIGVIPPANPRAASSDITIIGEKMTGGPRYEMFVGDVTGLVIQSSVLDNIVVAPAKDVQMSVVHTTYLALIKQPNPGATVNITGAG
jgi:hypothetical protein